MKTVDTVRFSSALCLMLVPATFAGAEGLADPAPIVSAFNETCRRGFPDLQAIRERAESLGWVRLSAQLVAPLSDSRLRSSDVPEFLSKGDIDLILSSPSPISSKFTCTISVPAEETLDTAGLARAVSVALDGAQASLAVVRGVELATWHVRSGLVVKASVGKSGDKRRAHLAVLTG